MQGSTITKQLKCGTVMFCEIQLQIYYKLKDQINYHLRKKKITVAPSSTLRSQTCLSLTFVKFDASKALVIQA